MVKYTLLKYYLILIDKFIKSLGTYSHFSKKYSKEKGVSWKTFWNHPDFFNKKNEYAKKQIYAKVKFESIYHKCSFKLEEISKINPYFRASFNEDID